MNKRTVCVFGLDILLHIRFTKSWDIFEENNDQLSFSLATLIVHHIFQINYWHGNGHSKYIKIIYKTCKK